MTFTAAALQRFAEDEENGSLEVNLEETPAVHPVKAIVIIPYASRRAGGSSLSRPLTGRWYTVIRPIGWRATR